MPLGLGSAVAGGHGTDAASAAEAALRQLTSGTVLAERGGFRRYRLPGCGGTGGSQSSVLQEVVGGSRSGGGGSAERSEWGSGGGSLQYSIWRRGMPAGRGGRA